MNWAESLTVIVTLLCFSYLTGRVLDHREFELRVRYDYFDDDDDSDGTTEENKGELVDS